MGALERIFEELERIAEPRELFLLTLAMTMVAYGAFGVRSDTVAVALIAIGSGMFFVGIFLPVLTEFQIGPGGFSAKLRGAATWPDSKAHYLARLRLKSFKKRGGPHCVPAS